MFGLGTPEIILIVLAIMLLFGAKKIPELMRGLGSGIKEFKQASKTESKADPEKLSQTNDNKTEN